MKNNVNDFNHNITNLTRRDQTATLLHDISYNYELDRNRLRGIEVDGTEIISSSYHYDALGNLIEDDVEEIEVNWNMIGKVRSVQTPNNVLQFTYNPFGQRQIKRTDNDSTYYVHDATGNVMGIYVKDYPKIIAKERPIYGSSRIGILNKYVEFDLAGNFLSKSNSTIGIKEYELSDHLGNVSVVVLDRKNCNNSVIKPVVKSYTDYYPFGYLISFRTHNFNYRYGFNGQEGDNDIYGSNKCYSYEFRNYDPRLGRWWGLDEFYTKSAWISPFAFVYNDVIRNKDIGGKYTSDGHYWTTYAMGLMIGLSNSDAIKWAVASETFDNFVYNTSRVENTFFVDKFTRLPGPLQWTHGLNGGSSAETKSYAKNKIMNGSLDFAHLFGDAYAHATKSSNYTIMYSPPWGHGSTKDPDNIGKNPYQYLAYVNDFASIMKTKTGKTGNLNYAVFEEVSKYQSQEVRTGILQSYIATQVGQQLTLPYSTDLETALKNLNIKYTVNTKTVEQVTSYKYGEVFTTTTKIIEINNNSNESNEKKSKGKESN